MNKKRENLLRILRLAEEGRLSVDDLITPAETFSVILDLSGNWVKPDGTTYTIEEKEREARKKGATFVTLILN